MATAYSNAVAVGTYNRIRLRVDYSGASASCHIEFSRTSSWTGQWADYNASITLNGTTQPSPYDYSGTVGTSWVEIASASGFTVPTAGGSLNWSFNNPTAGSVLGCSGTISIPAQASGPSGGSITNISSTYNSITATCALSSWGTSTSNAYKRLSVLEIGHHITTPSQPQYIDDNNTTNLSTIHTVNTSSTAINNPSWTIRPNTAYNIGIFASTSDGDYRYDYPSNPVYTLAIAPMVALNTVTDTTAVLGYNTVADGGALAKTIEYSLDGSTWNTGATISTGSASSGTFTITNLTASTTYNIQTRVTTTAGSAIGPTVTVTTSAPATTAALYGSVGGQTKKVKKLYGALNGQTKLIKKLYGSHNGVTKLVYEA